MKLKVMIGAITLLLLVLLAWALMPTALEVETTTVTQGRFERTVLRTDLIPTKGSKLCQDEFGTASLNNSGSAHACQ